MEQQTPPEIKAAWWLLTTLLGFATAAIGWAAKHLVSYTLSTIRRGKREAIQEAKREAMIREMYTALFGTDDHQGLIDQFAQVVDATTATTHSLEEILMVSPDLQMRIMQRRMELATQAHASGSGPHRALQHMPTGRVPTLRNLTYKPDPDSEPPKS